MKKSLVLLMAPAALAFLSACGDSVENVNQINQMGMEVVSSEDDLPKCNKDNEGEQALVKGESVVRVCVDGKWAAMDGAGGDYSCSTVELKDKSGLKIICNGDSIGVVYNGADGKQGKAGKDGEDGDSGSGCSITDRSDTAVVVVCGDSTMVIDLNVGLPNDTAEADSERTSISLDSVAGFTQKGPFLKGATVYLYELSDGRTLKQTNGNFTSKITSDDGHYKFSARDLVSQYAMVIVDGYYRNEVTGEASDAPIRLSALTDLRKRSSVNVNLLTNMEFDRVYNLVTRGDSTGKKLTVKAAKRQAQREILKQFHIELDGNTDAEDMDVFGATDADAALLAVSVLLQGDSNATALMVLLTEISDAIELNGEWNDSATRARLADWALKADADNRLSQFRKNVADWHLGDGVPDFEKFVRNYVGIETGLGVCGSDTVVVNAAVNIAEPHSAYYAETYAGTNPKQSKVRFICKTDGGARWRIATDLEKDTLGWTRDTVNGAIRNGRINMNLTYVFDDAAKAWRHGTSLDSVIGLSCMPTRIDTMLKAADNVWYRCVDSTMLQEGYEWNSAWRRASSIETDTLGWTRDTVNGAIRNGRINMNLTYVFDDAAKAWRHGTSLDSLLGLSCILARKDTLLRASAIDYYKCVGDTTVSFEESNWKSVWRRATDDDLDMDYWERNRNEIGLLLKSPFTGRTMVWDADSLREPMPVEQEWNRGCVKEMYENTENGYLIDTLYNGLAYTCSDTGWSKLGTFMDPRGRTVYKGVRIGSQTWMAENLNSRYYAGTDVYGNFCYGEEEDNCEKYGRLYTWAAAMDSAGSRSMDGAGCGYSKTCSSNYFVRGVCPEDWHLPRKTEWETLFKEVGGKDVAGKMLKSQTGWNSNGNGTDAIGFAALPVGYKNSYGFFKDYGNATIFWSSTEDGTTDAYAIHLYDNEENADLDIEGKDGEAYSVRCVKDN